MAVDTSSLVLAQFREAETAARRHLDRGEFAEAARYLRACRQLMVKYAEQPGVGPTVRRMRLEQAEKYLTRALQAEAQVARGDNQPTPIAAIAERTGRDDYMVAAEALITQADVDWEDIGGLAETKEALQLAYAMGVALQPQGITLQTAKRILLYGPPGTGKTLLAGALSKQLDATFFNARIPDLMSQYFGESSKLLSGLYAAAAMHAPALIFLDEIDALSRQRGGGQESGAERRLLNTFLGELDGLQAKRDDAPFVLTIGATNVPWDLDRAILSRFSGGLIYVPLPDETTRQAILAVHLGKRGLRTELPVDELVRRTEGLAGREIERVVSIATQRMVRRANPDILRRAVEGQDALRQYRLHTEPVTRRDVEEALVQVRPVTTPRQVERYVEWQKNME